MSEIEFVDQLPGQAAMQSRIHRKRMAEFAEAVKKQPGRWAIYPWPTTEGSARATASRISRGKVAAFGVGFEAVSSYGTVYVRWQGTER